ncbi:phage minor tail U family protein [Escherichia coli]|uniref:phage minor tail U family protein n=1 Tax=Escherichia coli TaxID=562 RepID=UPI000E03ED0E|nr:phage minor tail U family protein [Escherichia coli]STG07003.1 Minor tail protein U [Escherichia coli]
MNRHTQIRHRTGTPSGTVWRQRHVFDGLPAFVDAQELPAVAVWLSDAQYTGKMTDEDDWQAVLHIAVFIRAQAPDSELDMWMESTIFPALNDVPALSGLIDTLIHSVLTINVIMRWPPGDGGNHVPDHVHELRRW